MAAGMPDDVRRHRLVAGVLPSCGGLTAMTISAALEGTLGRDRRPQRYYLLDQLPLTDRGKISRKVFLEWIANHDRRVRLLG